MCYVRAYVFIPLSDFPLALSNSHIGVCLPLSVSASQPYGIDVGKAAGGNDDYTFSKITVGMTAQNCGLYCFILFLSYENG